MHKFVKFLYEILIICLSFCLILLLENNKNYEITSYAETINLTLNNDNSEKSETNGIYTSLSISINGGNNMVWTTVRNDITIFPSIVIVVVELYCSLEYTDNYENMALVAYNSISDLNIGETITAEASTNNETKYWIGRMRYNIDNSGWKNITTGVCKISYTGEFIDYI